MPGTPAFAAHTIVPQRATLRLLHAATTSTVSLNRRLSRQTGLGPVSVRSLRSALVRAGVTHSQTSTSSRASAGADSTKTTRSETVKRVWAPRNSASREGRVARCRTSR